MEFIEELTPLNLIFLGLAIFGIILAIIFYVNSKKEKSPVYNIKSAQLIKNNLSSIEKLQINYDGETLQNLYLTQISFWNAGRETINKSDFVKIDPLRIDSSNGNVIYDAKIDFSDERNNIGLSIKDKKTLKIKFDYLDKNQGVLLSIFHSENVKNLKIRGSFKGAEKLKIGYGKELVSNAIFNSKPIVWTENLINGNNRIVAGLVLLCFLPIMFVIGFATMPFAYIEKLYDKHYNNPPKEFRLE